MKYCVTARQTGVFCTPGGESFMLQAENLGKNLVRLEKSKLLAFFGRFCMGVLWRGFDKKMPIFGP
jgi:hypothetical protein